MLLRKADCPKTLAKLNLTIKSAEGAQRHMFRRVREADDRRWALASRAYAVGCLGMAFLSPWLLLPFGAAAIRAFAVPAGAKPAVIGAVETVVSVLVVVGVALAL